MFNLEFPILTSMQTHNHNIWRKQLLPTAVISWLNKVNALVSSPNFVIILLSFHKFQVAPTENCLFFVWCVCINFKSYKAFIISLAKLKARLLP